MVVMLRRAALAVTVLSLAGFGLGQHRLTTFGQGPSNLSHPFGHLKSVISVAVGGSFAVVLHADGTVGALTGIFAGFPPDGLANVKAVGAGGSFGAAVKNDGTVVVWGTPTSLALALPGDLSGVVSVAGGGDHAVALKSDGTVVAWGLNDLGQTNVPPGLNSVTAVAASFKHSLALRSDGTVVAWGNNGSGQCNVPVGLTNVVQVAASFGASFALKDDGTVVGWGSTNADMLPVPAGATNIKQLSVGLSHAVALKADGTLLTWGATQNSRLDPVAGLGRIRQIFAGGSMTYALLEDYVDPIVMPTVVGGGSNKINLSLPIPVPNDGKFYRVQLQYSGAVTGSEFPTLLSPGQTSFSVSLDYDSVDAETKAVVFGRLLRFVDEAELNFADGSIPCVEATVTVRPASLARLEAPTEAVPGGANAACKVALNGGAGPSGADVAVASLNSAVADSPGTIAIPHNSQSRTFNVPTKPVDVSGATTLRAQYAGLTRTATLTVVPAFVRDLVLTAAAVSGGVTISGNLVRVRGVAGPAGVQVTLASSHPAIAAVPQTLTIAPGNSQVSFKIDTRTVGSPKVVSIFAQAGGVSAVRQLTVNP